MDSSLVLLLLVLSCLVFNAATIAIAVQSTSSSSTQHKNLLPASRLVELELYHVDQTDISTFEKTHNAVTSVSSSLRFETFLRRRDGIDLYGRRIVHGADEPNYAHLSVMMPSDLTNQGHVNEMNAWDATLLLTPNNSKDKTDGMICDDSCFVAMNRFSVKPGCEERFEMRWAERNSRLPFQSGFLGFSLLRKREPSSQSETFRLFNYSTLTLWASYKAWVGWRSGEGRSSHDASRKSNRTPTTEWLTCQASPIFWDGTSTILADCGV